MLYVGEKVSGRVERKRNAAVWTAWYGRTGFFCRYHMETILSFLKAAIDENTSLDRIVDVFEEMCNIPIEEDLILFETGTFSFTGKPLFYFSLVRQFPNGREEYFQIHVDVLYKPTFENSKFEEIVWNDCLNENIFDYIRKSSTFDYARKQENVKIEIFMDET